MDKIRITLAASAILLTFGSGGSTAQSVTEIAAAAKLCKAISDDGHRLKCFDDLFAEKPNVSNTSEKSDLKAHWSIEEGKSPTDSPQIIAANIAGDTVLILRCKDQTTEAAFSTKYNYFGSKSVDVLLRVNDEKPLKEVWRVSITGNAAFASNPVEFIRMLPDNGKLFIRTIRFDGKTKDGRFSLGNVSEIRNKIAQGCDWAEAPGDDPIGSIDHPKRR
jgi:Type VI secretion system VasI, EvfG, VC_A0118